MELVVAQGAHSRVISDMLKHFHSRPVADISVAISDLLDRFGRDASRAIVPGDPLLVLKVD